MSRNESVEELSNLVGYFTRVCRPIVIIVCCSVVSFLVVFIR